MFQKIVDGCKNVFEKIVDVCRNLFEDIVANKIFVISIIIIIMLSLILDRIIYIQTIKKGRQEKEVEAVQIGFAKYEGEKFVWNTNVFENIKVVIDLIADVDEKIDEISETCLRTTELNLKNKEIISGIKSNLVNFSKRKE